MLTRDRCYLNSVLVWFEFIRSRFNVPSLHWPGYSGWFYWLTAATKWADFTVADASTLLCLVIILQCLLTISCTVCLNKFPHSQESPSFAFFCFCSTFQTACTQKNNFPVLCDVTKGFDTSPRLVISPPRKVFILPSDSVLYSPFEFFFCFFFCHGLFVQ